VRKTSLLILTLQCLIMYAALCQEPTSIAGADTVTKGTCVVLGWRADALAVASDSRATGENGVGRNTYSVCKMRSPAAGVLFTLTGLQSVTDRSGKVLWDGLNEAHSIFKALPNSITDDELAKKGSDWQDTFQKFVNDPLFKLPIEKPDDQEVTTLQVYFKRASGKPTVMIVRYRLVGGHVKRDPPGSASSPQQNVTKTIPFGSCSNFLGSDADRHELTPSEKEVYKKLAEVQKPAATTALALEKLALGYVTFAARVSAREAKDKHESANIAPPFSTARLGGNETRWNFHPADVCKPYLSPPPTLSSGRRLPRGTVRKPPSP
jgi:hypothetical protein